MLQIRKTENRLLDNRSITSKSEKVNSVSCVPESLCSRFNSKDAWVALSVECPTLHLGWGHDLRVPGSSWVSGSMLSEESA